MPGGEDYRRWYAMRDRLKKAGKWHGKNPPPHYVLELEEGEPRPKNPKGYKTDGYYQFGIVAHESSPEEIVQGTPPEAVPETPGTPESLPELEGTPTEEGKWRAPVFRYLCGPRMMRLFFKILRGRLEIEWNGKYYPMYVYCLMYVGIWIVTLNPFRARCIALGPTVVLLLATRLYIMR